MKKEILEWWCGISDMERFSIIEEAYYDRNMV